MRVITLSISNATDTYTTQVQIYRDNHHQPVRTHGLFVLGLLADLPLHRVGLLLLCLEIPTICDITGKDNRVWADTDVEQASQSLFPLSRVVGTIRLDVADAALIEEVMHDICISSRLENEPKVGQKDLWRFFCRTYSPLDLREACSRQLRRGCCTVSCK